MKKMQRSVFDELIEDCYRKITEEQKLFYDLKEMGFRDYVTLLHNGKS